MPVKKGGKKRKKNKNILPDNTPIIRRDEAQEYGIVTKLLGDRRVTTECFDGQTRCCLIRGKMRKRVWIAVGDIVLVSLRDFNENKGDIIHKYSKEHIKILEKEGEISTNIISQTGIGEEVDNFDDVFDFEDI